MKHTHARLSVAALMVVVGLLLACTEPSTESLLKGARSDLIKGDSKSAAIQLKSALAQTPGSGEARHLLGLALLNSGETEAAIVEFRKALDRHHAVDEVIPPLARTMLANRQYQKLVDEFAATELSGAIAKADLKTSLGYAYASLGNSTKAQEAIQDAIKAVPDFPATLALESRIAVVERRGDDALKLINRVVVATPNDPQAWFQKGEIHLLGKGDNAAAVDAFRRALNLQPTHLPARAGLVTVLLGQRDLKGASEQVAEMRRTLPQHIQTAYFDAQLAFANQDYKRAIELIEVVQKSAPKNLQVLQLAGTIQLANGGLLQAERLLSQALALQPNLPFARRRLAQTLLRMGQPAKALATLQPLLTKGDEVAQTYSIAGEAYIQTGNLEQARASFDRAVKLEPRDPTNRTFLAMSKRKSAGIEATVTELQSIAEKDLGTNADLALITLLLSNKSFDRALAAIDVVERKLPDNPLPANLRGRVHLMRADAPAARLNFERALAIDPVFVPAAASLANLDLLDQNTEAAKKRFETVLAVDPKNLDAQLAMVKLRDFEGAKKSEIGDLLAKAVQSNPTEPAPRLQLVEHLIAQREFKLALTAAQEASSVLPDQADLADALGRAQLIAGDTQQAIISFNKLSGLEPQSTRPSLRLAGAHLAGGNRSAADLHLRRALSLVPDLLEAQQALVRIALADKRPDDAVPIARQIQVQRPNDSVGYDLEAAIEMARNNRAGAENVYLKAIKARPRINLAIKLHTLLSTNRQNAEADKMAADWLARYPKDPEFLGYLGDLAMAQGHYDKAEKLFKSLAALQPANAAALNNIAWALVKQGKPGAQDYAERALKLFPNSPGLMDTLATVLAAEKQLAKALDVQKQALKLAPNDAAIRLNLAKLQLEAGDKVAASAELKTLEKLGKQFPAHAEVARLLKTL